MNGLHLLWLFVATLLTGTLAMLYQSKNEERVKLFLSFSGAFLLATCVTHLLPELFENKDVHVASFILLGFFLQILIEFISQGVEHGHIHKPLHSGTFPGLIFLGLCLHAFTEGLPLADTSQGATSNPLYWGILMHKLPISVVLVSLLSAHNVSGKISVMALIVFSALAPAGGLLGSAIASNFGMKLIPYFLAAATGIFLHISTVILFETSHNHRFNLLKFVFITAGGLLAFFLF